MSSEPITTGHPVLDVARGLANPQPTDDSIVAQ